MEAKEILNSGETERRAILSQAWWLPTLRSIGCDNRYPCRNLEVALLGSKEADSGCAPLHFIPSRQVMSRGCLG